MRYEPVSRAAIRAAEDAMQEVDPNASDETIANILADYLTVGNWGRSRAFHLSIFHDVRPSSLARMDRLRKLDPGYRPHDRIGPCPLPYDWTRTNIVGISTGDRERARQWIIEAALAGYSVFRHIGRHGGGFGQGSIKHIRTRRDTARAQAPRFVSGRVLPDQRSPRDE